VFYVDAAFDAAIAEGYMDLKFKNDLTYPILVTASARNGNLEIQIYGHETRPEGRTIAFQSELVEIIPPEPEQIKEDDQLPNGSILINAEPQNGYRYELYKIIFENGRMTSREKINTSTYRPVQGIVIRGTAN